MEISQYILTVAAMVMMDMIRYTPEIRKPILLVPLCDLFEVPAPVVGAKFCLGPGRIIVIVHLQQNWGDIRVTHER
jgi:hypothetical protein